MKERKLEENKPQRFRLPNSRSFLGNRTMTLAPSGRKLFAVGGKQFEIKTTDGTDENCVNLFPFLSFRPCCGSVNYDDISDSMNQEEKQLLRDHRLNLSLVQAKTIRIR
jgi:hypothetical protein